jgi:hypothetical protein
VAAFRHYIHQMTIGAWIRASVLALAAVAATATVSAAQSYGPPEPIGQGGAPVATPHYSPYQRGSPTYVPPAATSSYGRRVIIQPQRNRSQRKP